MSAAVLTALKITKDTWNALSPEQKRMVRQKLEAAKEQAKKGNKGMAAIMTKAAKRAVKVKKQAKGKRRK
jgi:TRAP-type C4-dicarboxylate transport system substrate-binding protein